MSQLADLGTYMRAMTLVDVVDILLVAGLFYGVLFLVRGTRAVQLIRGVLVLLLVTFLLSEVAHLRAFGWLLQVLLPAMLVAIPVIFQPELRRALEQLGRAGVLISRAPTVEKADPVVTVVSVAARRLSERGDGALILLERDTALGDLVDRGVRLDAEASVELLTQIFVKNSPLHDGAAIISHGRIAAAGVVLPIGDVRATGAAGYGLGTRHLAAMSATESTDALAVVVSEETGSISLARNGELERDLDEGELSQRLYRDYVVRERTADRFLRPLRRGAATVTWRRRAASGEETKSPLADGSVVDSSPEA
jgi:diadenylate cyclase